MSGFWKLNGIKLKGTEVTITPSVGSAVFNHRVRQALSDVHKGTQIREKLGKDLPTVSITFNIRGSDTEKWEELTDIYNVVEDDEVWTLEAPSGTTFKLYKNFKRAAFSTTGISQDPEHGIGRISLKVDAILNGIWIADDGEFCETIVGFFKKISGGTWEDQDGVNTGSTPLVELPQQSSGYPLAIRASDFAEAQPTISSTRTETNEDGITETFVKFDMTGFLIPAPTAVGDVGVYEICSSPGRAALGGGVDAAEAGGIASKEVGKFEVGIG